MTVTVGDRFRAALIHAALSLLLLGIALYLVFVLWYPAPLSEAVGVTSIYYLMLAIDLVLGPVLTFVVFKFDRVRLIFDLVVILFVQLTFYVYGLMIVSQARPEWLVFVIDDFELVRQVDIDRRAELGFQPEFRETLWDGPRWAAAVYSEDPDTARAQKEDEMFLGISLATRPETYVPLERRAEMIRESARPMAELQAFNEASALSVLDAYPGAAGWLPLKGYEKDQTVLVDDEGHVLGVVDLRPWD